MKFGKFVEEKTKPEWRLYYIDYKYLKQLIKEMKADISAGRQTKQDAENKFTKAIEHEINKVNDFFLLIDKEIQAKLLALRQLLNKTSDAEIVSKQKELNLEIDLLANQLNDLYAYSLVNFTGFRKILKKHDRHTDMVASPWFLARCKQQPFYASSNRFGSMLVKLGNCCARARSIINEKAPVDALGSLDSGDQFSANARTTRYWIKREDVMQVKTTIVKHVPVQMLTPNVRFPKEATDSTHILSVYYDNPHTLEAYESRVKREQGASSTRFRIYENSDQVCIERKIHQNSISGSINERFSLNPGDVFDFVRGTYKLEDYLSFLEQFDQSEEAITSACKLFSAVQTEILGRNYAPTISTSYDRSTFQQPIAPVISITIDTNVQMIKEKLKLENDGKWHKTELQITEDDIHEFPYAIMEIKVKPGFSSPDWLSQLVSGPFLKKASHFSKFVHATAALLPNLVKAHPPWMEEFLVAERKAEKPKAEGVEGDDIQFNEIWVSEADENAGLVADYEASQSLDRSRLESSSRENVRRVLSGRQSKTPSVWKRLQDLFNFDQRFVKDGKPVMSRMKIEPKTYFANERTFLQWMSFCVIIQGIGIALVSITDTNYMGMLSGTAFVAISIMFMCYALFMFRLRAARIRNNQPGRYDDFWGPFALFCVMSTAALMNGIIYVVKQTIVLSETLASSGSV